MEAQVKAFDKLPACADCGATHFKEKFPIRKQHILSARKSPHNFEQSINKHNCAEWKLKSKHSTNYQHSQIVAHSFREKKISDPESASFLHEICFIISNKAPPNIIAHNGSSAGMRDAAIVFSASSEKHDAATANVNSDAAAAAALLQQLHCAPVACVAMQDQTCRSIPGRYSSKSMERVQREARLRAEFGNDAGQKYGNDHGFDT